MKKRLPVFMLALCLIFGLTACQGGGSKTGSASSGQKVKLTFETSVYSEAPHKKAIDELIATYNKTHPNVEISVFGADYNKFWDNLTTEVSANNQGDIVQVYPENIPSYNDLQPEGAFVDLSTFMKGTDYESKLVGQEFCKEKDKVVALSDYAWGTTGIFYRKSMLQTAGIDPASIKNLDDFEAACKKVSTNGKLAMGVVVGTHAFTVSEWDRLVARPVTGGLYFKSDAKGPYTADNINCDSAANIWAAKWWQNFVLKDNVTKSVTDKSVSRELFWNGEAAFNMDGPWFIGMTEERDSKLLDDVGLIPQPDIVYQGKTYKPNPTNEPLVAMISKKCKNQQAAWDFLDWMTTAEAQKIIAQCGMIPSLKDYSGSDEYKNSHQMAYQFVDYINNDYASPLVSDPAIPQTNELANVMDDACQAMFSSKGADVETTLKDAASQMKDIMNK